MAAGTVNRTWRRVFYVHAALVVGLTTLVLVLFATTAPEAGVNIGAALLALPLLALGLPWTWLSIVDPYRFDGLSLFAWNMVTFGPALLNVVLHAVVLFVTENRRRA